MIIAQTNKKNGKAIWENKRRQDTKRIMKMKKGMISPVDFGGLCISSNITGRKF
jgi:hypothetical protein